METVMPPKHYQLQPVHVYRLKFDWPWPYYARFFRINCNIVTFEVYLAS